MTQKMQVKSNYNYNFNLYDPEVETATRQVDAVVSDEKGDDPDQDFDQADGCPIM